MPNDDMAVGSVFPVALAGDRREILKSGAARDPSQLEPAGKLLLRGMG